MSSEVSKKVHTYNRWIIHIHECHKLSSQKRLAKFVQLTFAFQDILNVWLGIGASNHENCFQMFISQSGSMSWLHKLHFWKCLLTNIRTKAEWLSCIHTAVNFIQSEPQYYIGLWRRDDRKTEGVKLVYYSRYFKKPISSLSDTWPQPTAGRRRCTLHRLYMHRKRRLGIDGLWKQAATGRCLTPAFLHRREGAAERLTPGF